MRVDAEPGRPRVELRAHIARDRDERRRVATGTRRRWPRRIGFDGSILLARASAAIVVPWLFASAVSVSPTRTTCTAAATTPRCDTHRNRSRRRSPTACADRRSRPRTGASAPGSDSAPRGLLAQVAVERAGVDATPREQELQHRDVPAEVAALQDARAEQRLAERARARVVCACRRADRQPVCPLEPVHRRRGRGPAIPSICAR